MWVYSRNKKSYDVEFDFEVYNVGLLLLLLLPARRTLEDVVPALELPVLLSIEVPAQLLTAPTGAAGDSWLEPWKGKGLCTLYIVGARPPAESGKMSMATLSPARFLAVDIMLATCNVDLCILCEAGE